MRLLASMAPVIGLLSVAATASAAPIVAYQESGTGTLRLFDAGAQTQLPPPFVPTTLDYNFRRVTLSHNGRFVGYRREGQVRLYDRAAGVELRIPGLGSGSFVTVTGDGNRIAWDAGSNPPISVFDRTLDRLLTNSELVLAEVGGQNQMRQPVFSADGQFITGTYLNGCPGGNATGSDICLLDVGTGLVTLDEIDGDDEDPCIDGDGSVLAVTAPTPTEHELYELDGGAGATVFTTPAAAATPVADERFCFLDSSGRYVAYTDSNTGQESLFDRSSATFLALPADIGTLAGLVDPYSPPAPAGPRKPVVGYLDGGGAVHLFDTQTGAERPTPGVTVPGAAKRWALSHDGRFIVWVEQDFDPAIHMLDRQTGAERALPGINAFTTGAGDRPGSPTVSDTGLIGFDTNLNGPTRVYDSGAGAFVDTGLDPANGHRLPRLSGDGRLLATNCINACETTLTGGNDEAYVQDLGTRADTGFPEDLSGDPNRDQQHPCINGDGSIVGIDANPSGAFAPKNVYLYNRVQSAPVSLPPGVNTAANDVRCRLDAGGQHLGIQDLSSGSFRLYSRPLDGLLLLPADATDPIAEVWLSAPYPPEPAPGLGPGPAPLPPPPPPPPAPPPPAAGGDTRAPRLRLSGARRQRLLRSRSVKLAATCDEGCSLTATGTLSTGRTSRTFTLRRSNATLRAKGRARLVLRIPRRALAPLRQALARRSRVVATIRVVARDGAGNRSRARLTVRGRR